MLNKNKADKIAQILDNKAKDNSKKLNISYEEGLRLAIQRMMKENPIAAMAFALS